MGQAKKLSLCRISKTEFPINVSSSPINMFKHLKMPSFQNQHTCKGYNYFLDKICCIKQVFLHQNNLFFLGAISPIFRYQVKNVAFHFLNKHNAAELPNDSKKGYEKMECNTHYSVSEFDINPGIACLNDRKLVVFFKICLPAEHVFLIQESSNEVLVEPKNCPKTKILHSYCTYFSTFYSKEGEKEPADCET